MIQMDEAAQKLLDNGWSIKLYRNQLGSYTARAQRKDRKVPAEGLFITDDSTPSKAIIRLAEKILFGRVIKSTGAKGE